jgi:hypothetical protein
MNLTPINDRKHGGALARDWRDLLQTLCDLGDYLLFFRQTWGLREAFSTLDNVPRKLIDSEIAADNASTVVRAGVESGEIAISCTHLRHLCDCTGIVKHVKHGSSKECPKLEKVLGKRTRTTL